MKCKRKLFIILLSATVVIAAGLAGFAAYGSQRLDALGDMSFDDMLSYTTQNKKSAAITVGILQNGKAQWTVYGENGTVLPQELRTYEIGSLTKTFTASLLAKAVSEGKVSLNDGVDRYLNLPEKDYYPTLRRLITHTSGCRAFYFETPMFTNFLYGGNDFYRITQSMVEKRLGKLDLEDHDYPFSYSNFGLSVAGLVLQNVYGTEYRTLMDTYISDELCLKNTRLSTGSGEAENGWLWKDGDAYLPAGALLSNIEDMLSYARLQIEETPCYLALSHEALARGTNSAQNEGIGIRVDTVGMGWMIDEENGIVWHNGGTSNYNAYLGFDAKKKVAVVILSNLPPNYKIPATVMGVALLKDLQSAN